MISNIKYSGGSKFPSNSPAKGSLAKSFRVFKKRERRAIKLRARAGIIAVFLGNK